MSDKCVVVIGQCGVDGPRIERLVQEVEPGCRVERANDPAELQRCLATGPRLALVNRQLVGTFEDDAGIELIRRIRHDHPGVRLLLVSDHDEAQRQAADAGAVEGFGKADLAGGRAAERLRSALA